MKRSYEELFEKIRHSYERLPQELKDDKIIVLAVQGIEEVGKNFKAYRSKCTVSKPFFHELIDNIEKISKHKHEEAEQLKDTCFMLVEALSIIMQEAAMLEGCKKPVQRALIDNFKKSGEWSRGDGTLVSAYFYEELPKKYQRSKSKQ